MAGIQSGPPLAEALARIASDLALGESPRNAGVREALRAANAGERPEIRAQIAAMLGMIEDETVSDDNLLDSVSRSIDNLQQALSQPMAVQAPHIAQDPELIADFVHEAREHLDAIEAHLLSIEEQRNTDDAVHAIFRGFHTIKGLAGFLELPLIQEVAHETETALDQVR